MSRPKGPSVLDKLYFPLFKTLPFYSKFHLFLVKYEVSSSRIKGLSDKFYIACPPPGPGLPSRAVNLPSQCPRSLLRPSPFTNKNLLRHYAKQV